MKLMKLCEIVLEGIKKNPKANWAGHIIVPSYCAQDFRDMGLNVVVNNNNDAVVGEE